MSTHLLEQICDEVDSLYSDGKDIYVIDVLKKLKVDSSHPAAEEFRSFTREYMVLLSNHKKEMRELGLQEEIDTDRVVKNGTIFGALGLLFVPEYTPFDLEMYGVTLGTAALIGIGLTLYDETKKKGINLFYTGLGTFAGGIICGLFELLTESDFARHFGAAFGGLTGYLRDLEISEPEDNPAGQLDTKMKELNSEYRTKKEI